MGLVLLAWEHALILMCFVCFVFVCLCVRVCLHLSSVVYQDGFYGADIYVSIRMPSLNAHVHDPPAPLIPLRP